ncbi:hypothetical protein B4U79_00559 [Dinothrombium tinctorium]|uniref:Uncharacterized protein n=1 Tax=Dinothrombium tinctorium TaxID=1965070 RepID=A0A3S3SMZ1_9ACAR|nr:hypothetical protein B4U79_00559 [Dinothrombium tinctorium]
MQANQSFN